jgi:hypothetical protein
MNMHQKGQGTVSASEKGGGQVADLHKDFQ